MSEIMVVVLNTFKLDDTIQILSFLPLQGRFIRLIKREQRQDDTPIQTNIFQTIRPFTILKVKGSFSSSDMPIAKDFIYNSYRDLFFLGFLKYSQRLSFLNIIAKDGIERVFDTMLFDNKYTYLNMIKRAEGIIWIRRIENCEAIEGSNKGIFLQLSFTDLLDQVFKDIPVMDIKGLECPLLEKQGRGCLEKLSTNLKTDLNKGKTLLHVYLEKEGVLKPNPKAFLRIYTIYTYPSHIEGKAFPHLLNSDSVTRIDY